MQRTEQWRSLQVWLAIPIWNRHSINHKYARLITPKLLWILSLHAWEKRGVFKFTSYIMKHWCTIEMQHNKIGSYFHGRHITLLYQSSNYDICSHMKLWLSTCAKRLDAIDRMEDSNHIKLGLYNKKTKLHLFQNLKYNPRLFFSKKKERKTKSKIKFSSTPTISGCKYLKKVGDITIILVFKLRAHHI